MTSAIINAFMRPLETMVLIVQYDKIICFQNAYILFHLFISKYTLGISLE